MEKLDRKINAWLREHLIPRLANIFEEQCSISEVECSVARPTGSFYLSDLFFADIRFPERQSRVLVKLPPQDQNVRSVQNYNNLFHNEILFYKQVADNGSNFNHPECYVCGDDPVFGKVIVLQNACVHGYFVSPKKVNVQLNYVIAGLKAIAKFHACTYAMKEKSPKKFREIEKKIINERYNDPPSNKSFVEHLHDRLKRVPRFLKKRNNYDPVFVERMSNILEDCYTQIMLRTVKPVEPLATIIHGDCTINNVMFRKRADTTDGEGIEAMLIDFALMIYSSPAIDISTFIYLSCSREDIKKHTRRLLKTYHNSLQDNMKDRGVWDAEKYSFETFWEDYKQRAIFGYVIAAFFLPMMTEYEKDNEVLELDGSVVAQINLNGGGEPLSNSLVDMLIDMHEAGFLNDYTNVNHKKLNSSNESSR